MGKNAGVCKYNIVAFTVDHMRDLATDLGQLPQVSPALKLVQTPPGTAEKMLGNKINGYLIVNKRPYITKAMIGGAYCVNIDMMAI